MKNLMVRPYRLLLIFWNNMSNNNSYHHAYVCFVGNKECVRVFPVIIQKRERR
jgi:hypothetical protein